MRDGGNELCALPETAADPDRSAMSLYQLLDQGEPDPAALVRTPALPFNPVKSLKNSRQLARWDAHASVADDQIHAVFRGPKCNGNAAFQGKLESIGDQ